MTSSGEMDASAACLPQFFNVAAEMEDLYRDMSELEDVAAANIKPSSGKCSQLSISLAEADTNSRIKFLTCLKNRIFIIIHNNNTYLHQ